VKWPFAGLDRRLAFLRLTLLAAAFLGLLASTPAWMNIRLFPLAPISPWFPILPTPIDKIWFGAMLASLIAALWFYRPAVAFFLAASFFAFCEDQNRGQPWLYMYWVMLALTFTSGKASVAACRVAVSLVYFWSGIQKLNSAFFETIPSWFVAPAVKWHWPDLAVQALKLAVASAPFLELAIAFLLWIRPLRKMVIVSALVLHGVSLIFLGPLGYNYNWVVWPWNAAMMALVFGLFSSAPFFEGKLGAGHAIMSPAPTKTSKAPKSTKSRREAAQDHGAGLLTFASTLRELRPFKLIIVFLLLFAMLPALSFGGWWDSYFSFSLYAQNAAKANVFITQRFADRLPAALRKYVQPFNASYDPQHQGPLMFGFDPWCYEDLHVPPIPEVRNFKAIFAALRKYADRPQELRMVIGPRAGPVIFLEGDRIELLGRK
jgi:hypothetical protein